VKRRLVLRIRLRLHHHAPQQRSLGLTFQKQAADKLGGDHLGGAGEEALGECWESVVGFGSG